MQTRARTQQWSTQHAARVQQDCYASQKLNLKTLLRTSSAFKSVSKPPHKLADKPKVTAHEVTVPAYALK
jgi:hypothetical protein